MPTIYIYVFKWFKLSKKTKKASEVCTHTQKKNKKKRCKDPLVTSMGIILVELSTISVRPTPD